MATRNLILIGIVAISIAVMARMAVLKIPRIKWLRNLLKGVCISPCTISILAVLLFPGLSSVKTTDPFPYASVTLQLNDESRLETYTDDGSCRKLSMAVYYPTGKDIETKVAL